MYTPNAHNKEQVVGTTDGSLSLMKDCSLLFVRQPDKAAKRSRAEHAQFAIRTLPRMSANPWRTSNAPMSEVSLFTPSGTASVALERVGGGRFGNGLCATMSAALGGLVGLGTAGILGDAVGWRDAPAELTGKVVGASTAVASYASCRKLQLPNAFVITDTSGMTSAFYLDKTETLSSAQKFFQAIVHCRENGRRDAGDRTAPQ